jgi:hypothetical protein
MTLSSKNGYALVDKRLFIPEKDLPTHILHVDKSACGLKIHFSELNPIVVQKRWQNGEKACEY